jgi:heptosyltransferase-2
MEGVLASHPAVSTVITFDKLGKDKGWRGILQVARRLRENRYDLAFVLPGSIRTALAVYLARIPRRIGTDQSSGILLFADQVKFPKELKSSPHGRPTILVERLWKLVGGKHSFVSPLYTDVVPLEREKTAIERHLQLLAPLGISTQAELLSPRLYPTDLDEKAVDDILLSLPKEKLIAVAPGSIWPTKRWPVDRYAALAEELVKQGFTVVLIGGETDAEICNQIAASFHSKGLVNACGRLTPLQSAAALKRCCLLVTNDSAPAHLARAVGTPCVAIFGPTSPVFGFAPQGPHDRVIERTSLWCRPCTPHGGSRCPIGTHECMTAISVDEVRAVVFHLLETLEN